MNQLTLCSLPTDQCFCTVYTFVLCTYLRLIIYYKFLCFQCFLETGNNFLLTHYDFVILLIVVYYFTTILLSGHLIRNTGTKQNITGILDVIQFRCTYSCPETEFLHLIFILVCNIHTTDKTHKPIHILFPNQCYKIISAKSCCDFITFYHIGQHACINPHNLICLHMLQHFIHIFKIMDIKEEGNVLI